MMVPLLAYIVAAKELREPPTLEFSPKINIEGEELVYLTTDNFASRATGQVAHKIQHLYIIEGGKP